MKKLTLTFMALIALALPAVADTLVLKNGEKISGYFEGGTPRVIKFRAADGVVKDYDLFTVQQIQFGDEKITSTSTSSTSSTSTSTASSLNNGADPRLLPGGSRVTHPTSSSAANTAWTIPTGSKIVIRTIDSINSEKNKIGDQFIAVLDEPVSQQGIEVIPRGADVRGRIAKVNEAGHISGAAELGLELTQITVNGIPYSVATSEYQEAAQSRGGQTAKRAAGGAAVGAIIGAIAGGGKGAAIGAGAGAGTATAVQMVTKGEKLNIPSETKLEFTLRSPLVVAAR